MPAPIANARKSALLPLHIDTTSFTNAQPQSLYPWRRVFNKRQLPLIVLSFLFIASVSWNLVQHGRHQRTIATLTGVPNIRDDPQPLPPLPRLRRAVIVAGHAIFTGNPAQDDLTLDDNWILEPFQRGGQVNTFIKHIQKGIEIARDDPTAMLIFSGGETRANAGPRSEALSYWLIAEKLIKDQGGDVGLMARMVTEEYARDSLENVLFSSCRFAEMAGHYPTFITVVGFEFKRKRFESLHRVALRYPEENFVYVGIDPPFDIASAAERLAGESVHSVGPFQKDLYGCHDTLRQKKMNRNPFRRQSPYRDTCPELAKLIDYCPNDNTIFPGPLPWDDSTS